MGMLRVKTAPPPLEGCSKSKNTDVPPCLAVPGLGIESWRRQAGRAAETGFCREANGAGG